MISWLKRLFSRKGPKRVGAPSIEVCQYCGAPTPDPIIEPDVNTGKVRVGFVSCCRDRLVYATRLRMLRG